MPPQATVAQQLEQLAVAETMAQLNGGPTEEIERQRTQLMAQAKCEECKKIFELTEGRPRHVNYEAQWVRAIGRCADLKDAIKQTYNVRKQASMEQFIMLAAHELKGEMPREPPKWFTSEKLKALWIETAAAIGSLGYEACVTAANPEMML